MYAWTLLGLRAIRPLDCAGGLRSQARLPPSTQGISSPKSLLSSQCASDEFGFSFTASRATTMPRPRRLLHQLIIMVVVSRLKHPVLTKRQAQVGLEALPVRRLTPNGVRGAAKGFDVAPVSSAARLPEGRIVSERSQSMSARGQEPEAPSEAVRQHRL